MTSCEEVDLRVRCNDPEPVILTLKGVHRGPLIQIPDPDGLVLAGGQDEILVWVEETATGVLEVASAGIDLPLDWVSIHHAISE